MRSLIRQVLWLKCGDDRFVFLHAGDQSISHSTPNYSSTMPHIMRFRTYALLLTVRFDDVISWHNNVSQQSLLHHMTGYETQT